MNRASEINYPLMVTALIKSGADLLASLTPEKADAWHMVTGVAGEAGELLDAIVSFYYGDSPLDRDNVAEELGDLEFYLEGVRQRYGVERAVAVVLASSLVSAVGRLTVASLDLLDTVKKEVVYNKAIDRERLVDCLGKIEGYMELIRKSTGIDRKDVLEGNIVKLYLGNEKNKARFPSGSFTDADAQARADKIDQIGNEPVWPRVTTATLTSVTGSLGEEVTA